MSAARELACATALLLALVAGPAVAGPGAHLPPLPPGWPDVLQLGLADSPGGAAALRATSGLGFRYQYLSGGLGNGWVRWGNGQFVRDYVRESVLHEFTPVFSYYMLLQLGSGGGSEGDILAANLQNAGLMADYFDDLRRFFEQAPPSRKARSSCTSSQTSGGTCISGGVTTALASRSRWARPGCPTWPDCRTR